MGIDKEKTLMTATEEMRRKAEALVRKSTAGLKLNLSHDETLRFLHELEVHQIELQMQNEELVQAKDELEQSRNTYAELYDFSPTAYFIFDKRGVILEVNRTGAELLGRERRLLIDNPFSGFIADEKAKAVFSRHLGTVPQDDQMQRCEVGLSGKNVSLVYAHLKSVILDSDDCKGCYILCSVVDGTLGKLLADELQKAHDKLELVVQERTVELTKTNIQLIQEIEVRKSAEVSLQKAYSEIKLLRDQLQAENFYLKQEVAKQYNYGDIIGQARPCRVYSCRSNRLPP